jgi:hypothetical protein
LPLRDLLAVPKFNPKFIACPNQFVCQFLRGNLGDTLRLENLLDVVKEKDPDLLHWHLVADRNPSGTLWPIGTGNIRDGNQGPPVVSGPVADPRRHVGIDGA